MEQWVLISTEPQIPRWNMGIAAHGLGFLFKWPRCWIKVKSARRRGECPLLFIRRSLPEVIRMVAAEQDFYIHLKLVRPGDSIPIGFKRSTFIFNSSTFHPCSCIWWIAGEPLTCSEKELRRDVCVFLMLLAGFNVFSNYTLIYLRKDTQEVPKLFEGGLKREIPALEWRIKFKHNSSLVGNIWKRKQKVNTQYTVRHKCVFFSRLPVMRNVRPCL